MENNDEKLTYSVGTHHPLTEVAEILQVKTADDRRGAEKDPCRTRSITAPLPSYLQYIELKTVIRPQI